MNREKIQEILENKYQSLTSYKDKIIFLYALIMQSQGYYLEYSKKIGIINLNDIIKKANNIHNDNEFIDFINTEILDKLNLGHLKLKFNEKIAYDLLPEELKIKKTEYDLKPNTSFQIEDHTMIITIPSFSRKHFVKESEKEVYKKIQIYLANNEIDDIIIDIRGNTGGTDEYFDLIFPLISNKDLTVNCSFKNLFTNQNEDHSYVIKTNHNNPKYNIYLLVDRNVFSTSETFTKCCKDNNLATIIGEPTRGEGYGLTPLAITLTNKAYTGKYKKNYVQIQGVQIVFPIEAPINELGEIDYINNYNTNPDIRCSKEEALAVALDIINENKITNKY